MPIATATNYLAAIAHIPPGASLRVDGVAWGDYEQLMYDLRESSAVRVFYDQGRMEIASRFTSHLKLVKALYTLMIALGDALEIDIESFGSSTLKDEMTSKGAEPDDSFYVQNAAAVIGKEASFPLLQAIAAQPAAKGQTDTQELRGPVLVPAGLGEYAVEVGHFLFPEKILERTGRWVGIRHSHRSGGPG